MPAGPSRSCGSTWRSCSCSKASPADAIELLDAVQPLDNMSLKRREELAITAAIAAGNAERARRAAERLFGLRLDTETQIRLSGPDAPARPARAGRRAARPRSPPCRRARASALVGADDAVSSGRASSTRPRRSRCRSCAARRSSLPAASRSAARLRTASTGGDAVLAASGRLPELIERTREQLKKTPNSVAMHHALADYYTAARQTDRAGTEWRKSWSCEPDDADLRLRLALQLVEGGDSAAACGITRRSSRRTPAGRGLDLRDDDPIRASGQDRRADRAAERSRRQAALRSRRARTSSA